MSKSHFALTYCLLKRTSGETYREKGWIGKNFPKYNMQPEQISMLEGDTLDSV
jgi:hypothetical protein